ncbi:uncharacterized protein [Nicotiana tomentosiformis]|uniref:uncharacterized protein n=1 Tax=Nicotiana tomentosiformis TaxID=4098 RepID=UPI00388CCDD4
MIIEVQHLWKMYFDGVSHRGGAGANEVFVTSQAATDYFSKWDKFVALKEVKKESVASFIRVNIIYRFGIPRCIITDYGKPFENRLMNKIYDLFGFKQCNSLMYNVSANGLAEAFNKTACNLLKKVVSKSKRDWHDQNARLRLAELEDLDEKRLEAQQSLEYYQARLSCAFNKRVRLRSFQVGDQVLAIRRPFIISHKLIGKFTSKLDGPYVVQESYSSGAYKLVDADGMRIGLINGKLLKKYYP